MMGFAIGRPENKTENQMLNEYQDRLSLCVNRDLRIIQLYREANKIYPQPLAEKEENADWKTEKMDSFPIGQWSDN